MYPSKKISNAVPIFNTSYAYNYKQYQQNPLLLNHFWHQVSRVSFYTFTLKDSDEAQILYTCLNSGVYSDINHFLFVGGIGEVCINWVIYLYMPRYCMIIFNIRLIHLNDWSEINQFFLLVSFAKVYYLYAPWKNRRYIA